jgi:hypothetical protein
MGLDGTKPTAKKIFSHFVDIDWLIKYLFYNGKKIDNIGYPP